jgi:hypothetical protein
MFRPGVIDQNSAHHLRSHAEKLRPVPPIHSRLINQPQPDFVNQSSGLQRVSWIFLAQVCAGHSSQFLVNKGEEVIESRPVASAPGD